MWPFRKKKTYLIIWSYGEHSSEIYSDLIKAHDMGLAWEKLKSDHPLPIFMRDIELVEG